MIGLAADHHAKRDIAVIFGAAIFLAVERHRDDGGNFQRAHHGHHVIGGTGGVERSGGAVEQSVGHIVVEAGLDDQKMRSGIGHGVT